MQKQITTLGILNLNVRVKPQMSCADLESFFCSRKLIKVCASHRCLLLSTLTSVAAEGEQLLLVQSLPVTHAHPGMFSSIPWLHNKVGIITSAHFLFFQQQAIIWAEKKSHFVNVLADMLAHKQESHTLLLRNG